MEMAKNKLKTTSMASERFTCALGKYIII